FEPPAAPSRHDDRGRGTAGGHGDERHLGPEPRAPHRARLRRGRPHGQGHPPRYRGGRDAPRGHRRLAPFLQARLSTHVLARRIPWATPKPSATPVSTNGPGSRTASSPWASRATRSSNSATSCSSSSPTWEESWTP